MYSMYVYFNEWRSNRVLFRCTYVCMYVYILSIWLAVYIYMYVCVYLKYVCLYANGWPFCLQEDAVYRGLHSGEGIICEQIGHAIEHDEKNDSLSINQQPTELREPRAHRICMDHQRQNNITKRQST